MTDVRSVKCMLCKGQMFYVGQLGYRKEFTIIIEENHNQIEQYYVHQDCWRKFVEKNVDNELRLEHEHKNPVQDVREKSFEECDLDVCPLYIPSIDPDENKGDCGAEGECAILWLEKYRECVRYKNVMKD